MAGETRGELAEAIAKVALENALSLRRSKNQVFWQKSPDGAVIKPDFTIGPDEHHPLIVVLVNASESPRNSDIKYWRNIGEVFDSKSRLDVTPNVLNLVFRSEIKPELIRLTAELCDATCLVDRSPLYGSQITEWLENNHATAPQQGEGRVNLVRETTTRDKGRFDRTFAKAVTDLSRDLSRILFNRKDQLQSLWTLCREDYFTRKDKDVRAARITLLRRGLARWLVFDESIRNQVLISHLTTGRVKLENVPDYAIGLGMLQRVIGSYQIPVADESINTMTGTTSRDLRLAAEFFHRASEGNVKRSAAALEEALLGAPKEMSTSAEMIRSIPEYVSNWHDFVLAHWGQLTEPSTCYTLLVECAADATMGAAVPASTGSRVWLWDHLVAMIRAAEGRNNDFGYSAMIAYFKPRQNDANLQALFNSTIQQLKDKEKRSAERWVSRTLPMSAEPGRRGFQDWLAGTKQVSPVIIAAFAFALAGILKRIKEPKGVEVSGVLDAHAYNLWNKLLTHQDFEPLPTLIEAACSTKVRRTSAQSVMGELAGSTIQDAGKMPVLAFENGIIFWQSVTQAGRDHKRKELTGRARALKYERRGRRFSRRESALKMILVLDGEWRDLDLKVLYDSGWDEIFYPDEMDNLLAAIEETGT